MAYEIMFANPTFDDSVEVLFLCSTGSWERFCRWAAAELPVADYTQVHRLCADGSVKDTLKLSVELEEARNEHGPDDAGVEATLDRLIDVVGYGDEGETVTVTG